LMLHQEHLGLINPEKPARVPTGPGDDLYARTTRYDDSGIRNLAIRLNKPVDNLLGLAFTIDFDTVIFRSSYFRIQAPEEGPTLVWSGKSYTADKLSLEDPIVHYAFTFTDHQDRP